MINIKKRLNNLRLLDDAIANENDEWGNTPEEWEVHLEILVPGGAVEEDLPFCITYFTCPYIKINGSICSKDCTRVEGCNEHWNRKNKGPGNQCKFKSCKKYTRSANGYCQKHHSNRKFI